MVWYWCNIAAVLPTFIDYCGLVSGAFSRLLVCQPPIQLPYPYFIPFWRSCIFILPRIASRFFLPPLPPHPPQPQPKPGFSSSVISFRTYRVCKRALENCAVSLQKMCLGFLILSITRSSEKALYSSPYPSCQPLTRCSAGDGNCSKKTAVFGLYF